MILQAKKISLTTSRRIKRKKMRKSRRLYRMLATTKSTFRGLLTTNPRGYYFRFLFGFSILLILFKKSNIFFMFVHSYTSSSVPFCIQRGEEGKRNLVPSMWKVCSKKRSEKMQPFPQQRGMEEKPGWGGR